MAAKKKPARKKPAKKKAAPAPRTTKKKATKKTKAPRRKAPAVETLTTLAPALAEVPSPPSPEPEPATLTTLAPDLAEVIPPPPPAEPCPPAPPVRAARFDASEGAQDLVLPVEGVQGGGGPPFVIRARGRLGDEEVGLSLILRSDMRPGMTAQGEVDHACFYPHGAVWRSLGPASDALGRALTRALGVPREGTFPGELGFTAFALQGDPRRLAQEPVRFRLFQERPVLEVILDVNLPAGEVGLREKDPSFRANLARTLLA